MLPEPEPKNESLTPDLEIGRPGRPERDLVVDLLSRQLDEHGIPVEATRLAAAVDGVLEDDRRGFFLVARTGGAVIGVAYVSLVWALEHGGKAAWLEELYVLPEWRERGTGARMLEAVLDEVRKLGCAALDLEVEATHERAARLYARHGFRRHARARWVRILS